MTGLNSHPNATTIRRFLMKLGKNKLIEFQKVHDKYRQFLIDKPKPVPSFFFDCDTTVLTVYGQQENARKGYNPTKPGRRSYHPIFCFEGHTHDC